MSTWKRVLRVVACTVVVVVFGTFAGRLFLGWRESAYPWTDRGGPHWATVHVQNDTRDTLAFHYLPPSRLAELERDKLPKYEVDPGGRRDFGVIPRIFGNPLDDADSSGPAELACLLRLPGAELMLFPVLLVGRDHVLVRVHADGRVTTSRGDESLLGFVEFGEEHAVTHAPPSGPPWRTPTAERDVPSAR